MLTVRIPVQKERLMFISSCNQLLYVLTIKESLCVCTHDVINLSHSLQGLSVFPVLPLPAYILCAVYGLWLAVAIIVYIFVPRSVKKVSSYSLTHQTSQKVAEIQLKSRNSSFSSLKGPQRLDKNIISEDKMVQLRKKSIDYLESNRTRDQLNLEFKHHPLYSKPYENGHYEDRSDSKPDQESDSESDDLETSQVRRICMYT